MPVQLEHPAGTLTDIREIQLEHPPGTLTRLGEIQLEHPDNTITKVFEYRPPTLLVSRIVSFQYPIIDIYNLDTRTSSQTVSLANQNNRPGALGLGGIRRFEDSVFTLQRGVLYSYTLDLGYVSSLSVSGTINNTFIGVSATRLYFVVEQSNILVYNRSGQAVASENISLAITATSNAAVYNSEIYYIPGRHQDGTVINVYSLSGTLSRTITIPSGRYTQISVTSNRIYTILTGTGVTRSLRVFDHSGNRQTSEEFQISNPSGRIVGLEVLE